MHRYWENQFNVNIPWESFYSELKLCHDNRYRQFKYKLVNNILPTNVHLTKWKIKNMEECVTCKVKETYEHLFLNCVHVKNIWKIVVNIFSRCGLTQKIKLLKNIILGYRIGNDSYTDVNLIFTILGFCIYKAYILSEYRAKYVDIFHIFHSEMKVTIEILNKKDILFCTINKFFNLIENY